MEEEAAGGVQRAWPERNVELTSYEHGLLSPVLAKADGSAVNLRLGIRKRDDAYSVATLKVRIMDERERGGVGPRGYIDEDTANAVTFHLRRKLVARGEHTRVLICSTHPRDNESFGNLIPFVWEDLILERNKEKRVKKALDLLNEAMHLYKLVNVNLSHWVLAR